MTTETLIEDYEELKQTYNACEKEYIRMLNQYNKVVEQNRQLQHELMILKDKKCYQKKKKK